MNRRQFLKAGLVGGAVLAAGGAWVAWRELHETNNDSPPRDRVTEILNAIAPVLLAGALPMDAVERPRALAMIVSGVREILAAFPPAVRAEVDDLFRLLDIRPVRWAITGISTHWRDATAVDIGAFLDRWRRSRLALLQAGYFALHDLIMGAWYASEPAWMALGYAGPPSVE